MEHQGEHLDAPERVLVSPGTGVFSAVAAPPARLDVGTTVGYVVNGDAAVPVRSPFRGQLVSMVAVEGERLGRYDRVAWLRAS